MKDKCLISLWWETTEGKAVADCEVRMLEGLKEEEDFFIKSLIPRDSQNDCEIIVERVVKLYEHSAGSVTSFDSIDTMPTDRQKEIHNLIGCSLRIRRSSVLNSLYLDIENPFVRPISTT